MSNIWLICTSELSLEMQVECIQLGLFRFSREQQTIYVTDYKDSDIVDFSLIVNDTIEYLQDKNIGYVFLLGKAIASRESIELEAGGSEKQLKIGDCFVIKSSFQLYSETGTMEFTGNGTDHLLQIFSYLCIDNGFKQAKAVSLCEEPHISLFTRARQINYLTAFADQYSAVFYHLMRKKSVGNCLAFAMIDGFFGERMGGTSLAKLWDWLAPILGGLPKQNNAIPNNSKVKVIPGPMMVDRPPDELIYQKDRLERENLKLRLDVTQLQSKLESQTRDTEEMLACIFKERRQNNSDSETYTCKMCFDNTINTLVLPCCHAVICSVCSDKLANTINAKSCIYCRGNIQRVVKMIL